jgi:hypothetical protein
MHDKYAIPASREARRETCAPAEPTGIPAQHRLTIRHQFQDRADGRRKNGTGRRAPLFSGARSPCPASSLAHPDEKPPDRRPPKGKRHKRIRVRAGRATPPRHSAFRSLETGLRASRKEYSSMFYRSIANSDRSELNPMVDRLACSEAETQEFSEKFFGRSEVEGIDAETGGGVDVLQHVIDEQGLFGRGFDFAEGAVVDGGGGLA